MSKNKIQKGIVFLGLVIGAIIVIAVFANPDALKDVKTILISVVAYLGVFARQLISEKISDLLGLDDNSKDIKELQKTDVEMRYELTETQKKLDDTQDLANELLDKLNAIVDELERDDIEQINKTLESKKDERL